MKKSGKGGMLWGRFIKRLLLGVLALVLLAQLYFFLQICWWSGHNPDTTSVMRAQLADIRARNPKAGIQHTWVPYERISTNLKRAVIASEDSGFSEHDGVEWEAMQKAYEKNTQKNKVVRGGSTITQQLAKNLFLSGSRSYLRKGQELIITVMLEAVMDKQRIFEIYLNVVEFGSGVFGAEAAARHYYGIPAAKLGVEQSATLAVMLPNPRYYDRHRTTAYLARRAGIIQLRMPMVELP